MMRIVERGEMDDEGGGEKVEMLMGRGKEGVT